MSFYQQQPKIEEELDFHNLGHNVSPQGIEDYLFDYFIEARERGVKKIRLIVGRGLHSENGPVLPDRVCRVLAQFEEKKRIKYYYTEPSFDGNQSGSIIVEI